MLAAKVENERKKNEMKGEECHYLIVRFYSSFSSQRLHRQTMENESISIHKVNFVCVFFSTPRILYPSPGRQLTAGLPNEKLIRNGKLFGVHYYFCCLFIWLCVQCDRNHRICAQLASALLNSYHRCAAFREFSLRIFGMRKHGWNDTPALWPTIRKDGWVGESKRKWKLETREYKQKLKIKLKFY